jgi:hypothetical protein
MLESFVNIPYLDFFEPSFTMDIDSIENLLYNLNINTDDEVSSQSPGTDDVNENDSVLIVDDIEYVEAKNVARKTRKGTGKRSIVWKLGIELKRVEDEARFWQCLVCKRVMNKSTIYSASATSAPFRHLKTEHGIIERDKRFIQVEQEADSNSEPGTGSPIANSFNSLVQSRLFGKKLIDKLRYLFLQWIVCCHLALVMVENPFFLSFIRLINSTVLDYLPKSSNTLRGWVLGEYQRQKDIKKDIMRKSRSRISLSFDTWTAPFAKKHIISLIAHFVDENWERRHLQLSMSRLYGDHSGENVAAHIVPILHEWEIDGRINYFITDNEASNGTAIDHILRAIDPNYKRVDRQRRWIRCLAHTLNLTAQAFLLGENPETFEATVQGAELRNDIDELQRIWRDRGFIGKLTNIIRSIRRSPKQRTKFERIKVDASGDVEWLAAEEIPYQI